MSGLDATGRETSSQRCASEVTSAEAAAGRTGPGRTSAVSAIGEAVESGTTPGGVLAAGGGDKKEILWAYGWAETGFLGKRRLMSTATTFGLASPTKVVATLPVVLRLVPIPSAWCMTKTLRPSVARLAMPDHAGHLTITELAEMADPSETTVLRWGVGRARANVPVGGMGCIGGCQARRAPRRPAASAVGVPFSNWVRVLNNVVMKNRHVRQAGLGSWHSWQSRTGQER